MTKFDKFARDVLQKVVESIEIPRSYYEAATKRYRSLGDWFHRNESAIVKENPEVYPQGSFRLGTVTRPLNADFGYDLDLVCELREVEKDEDSQANLKNRVGGEVDAYAQAHGMKEPKEGRRCWKLIYTDKNGPNFHIDTLPAIPENETKKAKVARAIRPEDGVGPQVAATAIAITDNTSPRYELVTDDWQMSNPAGFAKWFEDRMRLAAQPHIEALLRESLYARVQDVPVYAWKTPLQVVVQLLKRHRDVMFAEQPEIMPISSIIATLAGRAYRNEGDVLEAIANVVERMPNLVSPTKPRVSNPANPGEDFADRWDTARADAFFAWIDQASRDIRTLREGINSPERLRRFLQQRFHVNADEGWLKASAALVVLTVPAAPHAVRISGAASPWSDG